MPSTLKAIADQIQAAAGDIGGFFKGKELQSIVTRVNQASANLQSLTDQSKFYRR